MKTSQIAGALFALALLIVAGCTPSGGPSSGAPATNIDGSKFLLTAAPQGAQHVIAAREAAKDGDEVVVEGRIGGSTDPWVEGQAAFDIVDPSLKACSDIPGDSCPTPWDYCCETGKLKTSKALVKVVDNSGNVVKARAKELLKLTELDTVVVRGKAVRDDAGNLIVMATGVYVKK